MNDDAIILDRVGIRRMPGFRRVGVGFSVDDLAPGINIIHGPNGSGKTTTAQAIVLLLWPDLTRDKAASLEGDFRYAGKRWRVDADSGRVTSECDGEKSDLLPVPPAEFRESYSLALHELIRADNASFAEAIARESAGGYSIESAADLLGYRSVVSRLSRESRELKLRKQALESAQKNQRQLNDKELELADKCTQRDRASAAAARAEMLRHAVARLDAEDEARARDAELSSFPDVMKELTGNELETLKALSDEAANLAYQIESFNREIEQGRAEARDCGLPDDGVPCEEIEKTRDLIQKLKALEDRKVSAQQNAVGAERKKKDEQEALGRQVDSEKLLSIDLDGIGLLHEFVENAQNTHAHIKACEAVREWLTPSERQSDQDIENLKAGRRLLLRWYRDSGAHGQYETANRAKVIGILAGTCLGLISIVLCFLLSWGWLVLLLPAVALAFWGAVPPVISNSAEVHRREFLLTGIDQPQRWTPQDVQKHIDTLDRMVAEVELQEERNKLWHDRYESEQKKLEQQSEDLDKRRLELASELGMSPDTGEAKLAWLVQTLRRWKSAAGDLAAVCSELKLIAEQSEELLSDINAGLQRCGCESVTNVSEAVGCLSALERKNGEYLRACESVKALEGRLADAEGRLSGIHEKRRSLFASLELDDGDEPGLHALCRKQEDYLRALRHHDEAGTVLRLAERKLAEHSVFEKGVLELTRVEIEGMLHEEELGAAEYERLNTEIIETGTELEMARKSHDVEHALSALEEILGRISNKREGDRKSVIGQLLVDCLDKHRREAQMPVVFERARDLFSNITRGGYRLEMAESGSSAFRAFDTVQNEVRKLDELSSGTRIQLLLAVRLAFMESRETGVKPPLVIDEALANSDDPRADTIIRAIIEICKTGRQVFYFTAQTDEVAKWTGALKEQDAVPYRVVDLAEVRELAERSIEIPKVSLEVKRIPLPGEMTRNQYGEVLGVPPVDPRRNVQSVHIWHLFDDNAVVYNLLASGVSRWGQVPQFIDHGGGELFENAQQQLAKATAMARAISIMCVTWKVGRGRPVDSVALAESGAVSSTFMDGMCELVESVHGDAGSLVAALGDHRLPRFRDQNKDKLIEYLEREGYLDAAEVVSPDEIRRRVMAAMSQEIARGIITRGDIDCMLGACEE